MKKLFVTLLFCSSFLIIHAQTSPAEMVAGNIARKMKDSLSLTEGQMQQIFAVNMQLHQKKLSMRQQYAGSAAVGMYLQKVENTRDSLYSIILSDNKYQLYKQKKKNLINNN